MANSDRKGGAPPALTAELCRGRLERKKVESILLKPSARLTAVGRSTKERSPVLQYVLHVYTMNLGFAKRLVGDLSEDQMCAQPHGVVNHPAWSLGHLAVVADHVGKLLGLSSDLPAGWEDTFKTGGIPAGDRSLFPGKDELLRVIAQQHARISQGLSDADPAALARPHPNEKSRAHFPTVGDLVIFLMTAHEMDHLGQIAAWRRAMGLGSAA
jgi:hypothetical protein